MKEEALLSEKAGAAGTKEASNIEKLAAEGKNTGGRKVRPAKKGKELPTQVPLGKGTRVFYDFLVQNQDKCMHAAYNKDLSMLLVENLSTRNESRRVPKCAKGTRDMTPL